ncbi:U32 family peptidase [Ruminococcus sp. 5_1_39BFAA]|uniref:peptidase U32 family protein n=1 Tax=Ruminococcus sp. 5_1_39BFAA TaxID=457412 RepID=UPI003566B2AF
MSQNHIELLAPAGSYEGFEAALGAGADAIYAGGDLFGARAYAKNFGQEEMLRAIDIAHIHGKKLYLTVNTLLKNRELYEQLPDYLRPYYETGLDAVIVQDMGVFSLIKQAFPGLHIHASTQMTVTGPAGMKFLEQLGADRVVAARELSLDELSEMHKASPIEIEAFIHGALCYSYSGQCLMSSLLGGRSGNRGRCAQPCRLPYQTALEGKKYKGTKDLCPLSLKDICTIELLPQIINAGVMSLKIEGRMKQPGYTAGVTRIYRKYLDLFLEKGGEDYQVEERDKKYLLDLFTRGGSCTGYYEMQNGPSMMAFSNEKKTGDVQPEIIKRKEKIYGNLILFPGSPVILEVSCRGTKVSASAGEVQFAKNQPMEEVRIRQQMEKLGNTPFMWENLDIDMDSRIFVPVKVLNEVRREALEALEKQLISPCKRDYHEPVRPSKKRGCNQMPMGNLPFYVSCEDDRTAEMLCRKEGVTGIYLPCSLMEKYLEKGLSYGKEMYLSLPHITRGLVPDGYWEQAEEWLSRGMKGFLVRNLETYAMLKERKLSHKCVIDHSLYTWNNEAVSFWEKEHILRNTVPLELNEGELRHRDNQNSEMLVYGYLPLMHSAQCIRKNLYGCSKREEKLFLKDRYDKEFPMECYCYPWKTGTTKEKSPCYNIIYNSLPYGLLKEKEQVKALGVSCIRISFTVETAAEAEKILHMFLDTCQQGQKSAGREFTKGHFKRGAE